MINRSRNRLAIRLTLVSLLLSASSLALSQESEAALLFAAEDEALEWGACPEFFQEGCQIAVLHGDPAQPNADILFKVPADSAIPRHRHTSAERMVLISGELHVNYDGQDPVVMRPGNYAYGPPELPHDGYCAAGEPCVLFIAFEAPVDAIPLNEGAEDPD